MAGAGAIDRTVWGEFYDPQSSALRMDALRDEFHRLWGDAAAELNGPPSQRSKMKQGDWSPWHSMSFSGSTQSRTRRGHAVLP
jgi:hypothetical protein